MEEFKIGVYEVSLHGEVIGKVPLGGLESFLNCVLQSNDSVSISLGFITQ